MSEKSYAGVSEIHFLEAYPLPWNAVVHTGMNRSAVIAADGTYVISGMNNAKAAFIADAVNRRDQTHPDQSGPSNGEEA